MLNHHYQIKPLLECQEQIPSLAKLWYEEIHKQWVPDSSIEKAKQKLFLHAQIEAMPLTFVALYDGQAIGMASLRDDDGIGNGLNTLVRKFGGGSCL